MVALLRPFTVIHNNNPIAAAVDPEGMPAMPAAKKISGEPDLTTLRVALFRNGYRPVPITAPDYQHVKVKSPGKQPFFSNWPKTCAESTEASVAAWTTGIS